jgi:alkanesulfonate monooxygenase SsuD/methylene tetrahydromethanopterin reductase-like flavin-dependent oxidoreductase (luciferase family)
MRYALMIEAQQGLSYVDQLALARRAEATGFEAFFRSDHYASFPGAAGRPTTDAWAVLAGLARETERISLGTLVSPVTFRHPGAFAKLVTTVDEMSGGRVEVGVGAGWNEDDHLPLGLPVPPIEERADLLEDQLAVLHGLWGEPDGWSYSGRQVRVEGARFRPKPVDRPGRPHAANGAVRARIILGTAGSRRAMRLAARYADELNFSSIGPDQLRDKIGQLDEVCREVGREPASLTRSVMVSALVGSTAAEVRDRRVALFEEVGGHGDPDAWFGQRQHRWILGTASEARAMAERFEAAGAERIMLQDFVPRDLAMIELMAEALF